MSILVDKNIKWKSALALLALGATLVSTSLSAQAFQPASNDEILAGVRECAAVTSGAGINEKRLIADGWSKAGMSENGKPITMTLAFYNKGRLLLTFDKATAKEPACFITARIPSIVEFPGLQAAVARDYGAPVKDDGKGEQMFIAPDRRIIDLASTGSKDKPAVRVAVGPVFQESK